MLILAGFLLSGAISCNQTNESQDDAEDMDFPFENRGEGITDFEELDKKMRHIMNDMPEKEGLYKNIEVVKADGAKEVAVRLEIGAGKLRLTGGASELLIAGFIYSDETWKPQIKYDLRGSAGELIIAQPESEDFNYSDEDKYVWNLKFNNQIPLDFDIELGAGISEIFLSDLNIQDFSMTMGVGKSEVDLRGNWEKSTTIHLIGGIGLSKVYLPSNVGILINIDKAIGALDIKGLIQKSRSEYVNKLYETADVVLTINIKTGIGQIEIE